ncbi:hypothetical protein Dsin_005398 [Dipteronia sinensis]|uniref:Uncharacterized protein n=1 Tax=Dipteronia sinensis TaxID=43782 RepID=A0AAE0AWD3_9ROSI|nr:hypothetical protein Dsin_005398 [Dipteronia sinensis]
MARGIGVPLKFDRATLEDDYGHFACMLIDVDLSKPLPNSIMIEVGKDCLYSTLYFENVPSFCSVCCSIGYTTASCINDKANVTKPDEAATSLLSCGNSKKTTLDPAASSSTLRPIILPGQKEALKYSAHLDVSADKLHTEHVDVDSMTDPIIVNMEPLIDPPMVEPHFTLLKVQLVLTLIVNAANQTSAIPQLWTSQVFMVESLRQINWKIQLGRRFPLKKGYTLLVLMLEISFIYASVNYITPRSLWNYLMDISGSDDPWLVLGDFNSVLGAHETTSNISTVSCDDFLAALTIGLVIHYCWEWYQVVVQKLKLLKKALRKWNYEVFGDIVLNITNANEKVMLIQGRIGSEGFSYDLFRLETVALTDLDSEAA